MYFHNHQNETVCNQLLSSNGDESRSYLPEELIVEILLILPVRSLIQFKCICKSWKTLISDPHFVNRHLRISNAKSSLTHKRLYFFHLEEPDNLLHYKPLYYPLKSLSQNLLPPVTFSDTMKQQYLIIGSCNGFLCMYDRYQHCVRLWNPSIRFKSKKSPEAFSLDWKIIQYGFGYDQVNDKYKVVLVALINANSQRFTKIYTFGEDSWKTIQSFCSTRIWPSTLFGKFVSDTLNWIVKKRGVRVILSFDLVKETYKEMLLPQDIDDKVFVCGHTLYVLNNCLGMCYQTNRTHWVAWLMKEYGVVESWIKFMIIPFEKFNKRPLYVIPLFITENGDVLLVYRDTTLCVLYNLNSGQFINSLDDSLKSTNTQRFSVHIYCESLVSLPW